MPRRFPPPWDIEEHNRSCFIVRDNNGQALSYVYYETVPGRRTAANLLTRDEARRIGQHRQAAELATEGLVCRHPDPLASAGITHRRGTQPGSTALRNTPPEAGRDLLPP